MVLVEVDMNFEQIYTWQYNGCDKWQTILNWCFLNLENQFWSNGYETLYFKNERAYVWFLLRWV